MTNASPLNRMSSPERGPYAYEVTIQGLAGYEDVIRTVEGPLFHGGRSRLAVGRLLTVGRRTNSWGDEGDRSSHIYFTEHLSTAVEYARKCDGTGYVYEVEPTGAFRTDYSPGDFKTADPLRIVRVVPTSEWS